MHSRSLYAADLGAILMTLQHLAVVYLVKVSLPYENLIGMEVK